MMKKKIVIGVVAAAVVAGIIVAGVLISKRPQNEQKIIKVEGTIKERTIFTGIQGEPSGLAVMKDGTVLVTDTYNKVIWQVKDGKTSILTGQISPENEYGEPVGGYSDTTLDKALFGEPWGIAPFLDGWAVTDSKNRVIRYFSEERVRTAAYKGSEPILTNPSGLTADEEGNLYIADAGTGYIYLMDEQGNLNVIADGFNGPTGLCYQNGVLYVADTGNHRVCSVKDGQVSVLAGKEEGFNDGKTSKAQFRNPQGIAVDENGTIYVADTGNSAIRVIENGQVKTLVVCSDDSTWPVSPKSLICYQNGLMVADSFSGIVFTMPCK